MSVSLRLMPAEPETTDAAAPEPEAPRPGLSGQAVLDSLPSHIAVLDARGTVFDANPHPMFVYDRETLAYLAVNDAAVRQYGYSREEFLRMTTRELCPSDEGPALLGMLSESRALFEQRGVWQHRTRDGAVL